MISYHVTHIRDGKSYSTRAVKAQQNGRVIFTCACSFAIPEMSVLEHQYTMPQVPAPSSVPTLKEKMESFLNDPKLPKKVHDTIKLHLSQPLPSDIKVIRYKEYGYKELIAQQPGETKQYMWIKSGDILPDEPSLHKVQIN